MPDFLMLSALQKRVLNAILFAKIYGIFLQVIVLQLKRLFF
jgi:hypothetical protein